MFTLGFVLGLPFGAAAFSVALLLIRDFREFRRRVRPLNEQAREEGRLRGLVLSGAVTTPVPGRPLRWKEGRINANGGQC